MHLNRQVPVRPTITGRVAALVSVFVFTGCSLVVTDSPQTTLTTTPTEAPPTNTSTLGPSRASSRDWTWARVDAAVFDGSSSVHGLGSDGETLVALGQRCIRNGPWLIGPCPGLSWTLEDETWSEPVPIGADEETLEVVLADAERGIVAAVNGPDSSGIWTRQRGRGWQPITDPAPFKAGADGGPTGGTGPADSLAVRVEALTAGPAGLVAVGHVGCYQRCTDIDRAAVWLSASGETWQRTPYQPAFRNGWMRDATRFGAGLVVVGNGIWRSPDGLAWERVTDGIGTGDHWLSAVALGGPGLVAVGSDALDAAFALVSTDGRAWQRAVIEPSNRISLNSVAASADGLVAVGRSYNPDRGLIWWSADGFSWQLLDTGRIFADTILSAVIEHRDAIYVAGTVRNGYPEQAAAVWIGRRAQP